MKPRFFISLYGIFACMAALLSLVALGSGARLALIWIGWTVVCFFMTIVILLAEWGTRP